MRDRARGSPRGREVRIVDRNFSVTSHLDGGVSGERILRLGHADGEIAEALGLEKGDLLLRLLHVRDARSSVDVLRNRLDLVLGEDGRAVGRRWVWDGAKEAWEVVGAARRWRGCVGKWCCG